MPEPAIQGQYPQEQESTTVSPSAVTLSQDQTVSAAPADSRDVQKHEPASLPDASGPFGTMLAPVLQSHCQDRLNDISWFRTDWQRGGALTGYATWQLDDDEPTDVVIKMPIPPCERVWLTNLQEAKNVAPKVYAHGESLNGYDLAWVVMERLPHGPLGTQWGGKAFDLLVQAVGRFYAASVSVPIQGKRRHRDWEKLYEKARRHVQSGSVHQQQRWKRALKAAGRKIHQWIDCWEQRPADQWVHGDLHLGNALTRSKPPDGPALLIDYALTRPGCWIEDAIYLEHLYWSLRDRLEGRRLCKMIAQERKKHGLPVEKNWPDLARAKRCLLAMSTPAMLYDDGKPQHVDAALELLESAT